MPDTVIHLQREAPAKPQLGAPCNGCGVCCALSPCPLALLRFRKLRGACPALCWSASETRYCCGLLAEPRQLLPFLPPVAHPLARRLIRRWIGTGIGCDCSAEVIPPEQATPPPAEQDSRHLSGTLLY